MFPRIEDAFLPEDKRSGESNFNRGYGKVLECPAYE